jgi:murein DD-endopeptidase MepM/ murein hydrolase activator NlpD
MGQAWSPSMKANGIATFVLVSLLVATDGCSHTTASAPVPGLPAPTPTPTPTPAVVPANVIAPPPSAIISGIVPAAGGTLTIPNVATVSWSAGTFPTPANVTVSATAKSDTATDFDGTTAGFFPGPKRLYELRINTGSALPTSAAHVTMTMPAALLSASPSGDGIQAFVEFLQEGGDDSIDGFRMVDSTVSFTQNTVQLDVDKAAFTSSRTADGSYEAILTLSPTPGTNTNVSTAGLARSKRLTAAASGAVCQAKSIGSPLEGVDPSQLVKTDDFKPPAHYGVDIRAADKDAVIAFEEVTIVRNTGVEQLSATKKNRFGMPSGWGYYILVKGADGSGYLYAHLLAGSTAGLKEGQRVPKGTVLGKADHSGGVTAPHLHFEYYPSGNTYSSGNQIDPWPCIGSTVSGGISVGDNGSAADDAFSVSVDGIDLGTTTVGGTNNIAVNNLRSGNHILTIKCVVAPDNDGTLGVALSNGWTFADGSTTRSADLTLNEVVNYPFLVPASAPTTQVITRMPRNWQRE